MFLSEYDHSLDDKGRLILPAKWRTALEGGAVVTSYPNNCLAVFTVEAFEEVANRVEAVSHDGPTQRAMASAFFGGATDVAIDKQGRIPLPQRLRDYAELIGEVTLVGQRSRIELWNKDRYARQRGVGLEMLQGDEGIKIFRPSH